jgi:hypothetical protein
MRVMTPTDKKIDTLTITVGALVTAVGGLGTRFDKVEERFSGVETRVDGLGTRFDRLEERFSGVETGVDGLGTRFDRLEEKLDDLTDTVDSLAQMTAREFIEIRKEMATKDELDRAIEKHSTMILSNYDSLAGRVKTLETNTLT